MRTSRPARLLAVSLLGTTLSAGVTLAAAPPAAAAPASTTYTCTFPLIGEVAVPLTLDVVDLPATLSTGVPVDPGAFDVDGALEIPDLAVLVLMLDYGLDAVRGTTSDLELTLGDVPVPVDLFSDLEELPLGDLLDLPLLGETGTFTPGLPGQVPLRLPETFNLGFTDDAAAGVFDVPCEMAPPEDQPAGEEEPGTVDTVTVTKQKATMKGRVLQKPVPSGKRPKVLISVWDEVNNGAVGTVVAQVAGRTIGKGSLTNGAMRLKLDRLGVGKWRVKLVYQGTETVAQSVNRVTVKVAPRRG